jgi:hypothetical protein
MFPKSQVATTCFSCSPPHSDSEKNPFLCKLLNYPSKSCISLSTRISKVRDSCGTTPSYQRNVFTFALQVSLVIRGLFSWRYTRQSVDRDGIVGIATRYGLDGPGIESRYGARFSAPVQTGPGAHPASCTIGTGPFPGVTWPGRGVNHPPPSSSEVKERVKLYLYSPAGPSWQVIRSTLPFTFYKRQS